MNQKNDYIAVFDSGIGGLSVLKKLLQLMPNQRYLYYGDSANAPYGTRTAEEVQQLCLNLTEKLVAQDIKALVIACNTATAVATEVLQKAYPELIVVGIEPPVPRAAAMFPGGQIGVMATPLTLRSPKILDLIDAHRHQSSFVPLPAPGLANLAEAGLGNSPESEALLRPLLEPYAGKLDAVILGCSHYPFSAKTIRKILGSDAAVLDGAPYTSAKVMQQLEAAGLLGDGPGEVVIQNSSPNPEMLQRSWALLGV